jgi:hypothetical protein
MLARVWTTGVRPQRVDDYERFARDISLPMFRTQQGFLGCIMSHRNGIARVLTVWSDADAIAALEQSPTYRATVEKILAADLLTGQQSTEVGEVHLFHLVHGGGAQPG